MDAYEENFIKICNLAIRVYREFQEKYDVENPKSKYYNYTGLCDASVIRFFDLMEEVYDEACIELHSEHGELAHSIRIPSKFWLYQHTWSIVKIYDKDRGKVYKYYVDITPRQFSYIVPELPSIVISRHPLDYLLPDANNIAVHSLFKWYEPIVVKFEYILKGKIYDFIGKFLKKHP